MSALHQMSEYRLKQIIYKEPSTDAEKREARNELNKRLKEREMKAEFETWEWLIKEDIRKLERRIQACYHGMQAAGVPRDMREAFVLDKLVSMIESITSE